MQDLEMRLRAVLKELHEGMEMLIEKNEPLRAKHSLLVADKLMVALIRDAMTISGAALDQCVKP